MGGKALYPWLFLSTLEIILDLIGRLNLSFEIRKIWSEWGETFGLNKVNRQNITHYNGHEIKICVQQSKKAKISESLKNLVKIWYI